MNLAAVLRHDELDTGALNGKRVLVLDVLRACTSIITALAGGATRVRITSSVAAARRLAGERLLAGERGGLKPAGFDFGNSPLEYAAGAVSGREIVFTSSNGALAAKKALAGVPEALGLAALVNMSAAARWLAQAGGMGRVPADAVLVCAGTEGGYSLEDTYAAGRLASALRTLVGGIEYDEGARLALAVFERYGLDAAAVFKASAHGRRLLALGFANDLEFAAGADRYALVPMHDGEGFISG